MAAGPSLGTAGGATRRMWRLLREAECSVAGHRLVVTLCVLCLVVWVSAVGLAAGVDRPAADASAVVRFQVLDLPVQPPVSGTPAAGTPAVVAAAPSTLQPFTEAAPAAGVSVPASPAVPVAVVTSSHSRVAAPTPDPIPAPESLPKSLPVSVSIRRLGINAPVMVVGRDRRGAIEVPPLGRRNLAGWYAHGPAPGEVGPAVLVGHKDTRVGPSVFALLASARRGDRVEVRRRDRTTAIFTVTGVEQAPKTAFPTARVYGRTEQARLRLITCGGSFSSSSGHYRDNVIVYAVLSGTRP